MSEAVLSHGLHRLPRVQISTGQRSFSLYGLTVWNHLPSPLSDHYLSQCAVCDGDYITVCAAFFFVQIINDEDVNWYRAEYNGRFGYVPANYVQYVRPP